MEQHVKEYTNRELRKLKGVYCLTFPNGKRYVGIVFGDTSFGHRFTCHISETNKFPKYPLHYAISHFGWNNIKKEIVLVSNDETVVKSLEKKLIAAWKLNIKRFGKDAQGYNCTDGGEGTSGPTGRPAWNKGLKGTMKHTEESKKLISEAQKEIMNDPIVKEKYRKILSEREWTQETRDKISKKMIGNTWNKGRVVPPEVGRKISKAKMGHSVSDECVDKIRNSKYHKNLGGMNNPAAKKRTFKNKLTGQVIEGAMKCVGRDLGYNGQTFSAMMLRNKQYKDWVWLDD